MFPFEQLTPRQKTTARTLFPDAGPGDGYVYYPTFDNDGLIRRTKNRLDDYDIRQLVPAHLVTGISVKAVA